MQRMRRVEIIRPERKVELLLTKIVLLRMIPKPGQFQFKVCLLICDEASA